MINRKNIERCIMCCEEFTKDNLIDHECVYESRHNYYGDALKSLRYLSEHVTVADRHLIKLMIKTIEKIWEDDAHAEKPPIEPR